MTNEEYRFLLELAVWGRRYAPADIAALSEREMRDHLGRLYELSRRLRSEILAPHDRANGIGPVEDEARA